jgi:hypothetical protein
MAVAWFHCVSCKIHLQWYLQMPAYMSPIFFHSNSSICSTSCRERARQIDSGDIRSRLISILCRLRHHTFYFFGHLTAKCSISLMVLLHILQRQSLPGHFATSTVWLLFRCCLVVAATMASRSCGLISLSRTISNGLWTVANLVVF